VVELHFDASCTVLSTGATVPRGFWKTLYWDGRVAKFYFPNQVINNKSWYDFRLK